MEGVKMSELFIEIVEELQKRICKEYGECVEIVWEVLEGLNKEDIEIFMSCNINGKVEMIMNLL